MPVLLIFLGGGASKAPEELNIEQHQHRQHLLLYCITPAVFVRRQWGCPETLGHYLRTQEYIVCEQE